MMDREAWRAAVYGVTKSQSQLSDWTDYVFKPLMGSWNKFWTLSYKSILAKCVK